MLNWLLSFFWKKQERKARVHRLQSQQKARLVMHKLIDAVRDDKITITAADKRMERAMHWAKRKDVWKEAPPGGEALYAQIWANVRQQKLG